MMRDIFYFFQMDLIFSNPGFLHIAQKICHNLKPEALKTFCYTNKNILAHCNAMWIEILKQNHFNAKYSRVLVSLVSLLTSCLKIRYYLCDVNKLVVCVHVEIIDTWI